MLRNEDKLCNALGTEQGGARKEDMLKKNWMIPMFDADGGGGAGTGGGDGKGEPNGSGGNKHLSFDDFLKDNKDNQAEFDRRINKGIQTALNNEKIRLEALADEKISEAEKMSKMNDIEKKEYQQKKEATAIAEREAAITKRELMAEAKNTLANKSMPQELAEILTYTDADSCKKSIEALENAFNKAVATAVEEKLKGGKPPKDASKNDDDPDIGIGAGGFVSIIKENQSKR